MEKRYIGPQELSQYLDMKPDTIYSWIWQRKIPHFKVGGRVKFDLLEIDEWLKAKKVQEIN